MSSLLQFSGRVKDGRVGLQIYLTEDGISYKEEKEPILCTKCGGAHPQVYIAYRKPAGMFGCWVVFRMNGKEIAPDLSGPMSIATLPRDAIKLTKDENSELWHN